MSLAVTIGRVVWRGIQATLGTALAVLGLTWLNLVASSVLSVGGSCSSGGPYAVGGAVPGRGLDGAGRRSSWPSAGSASTCCAVRPAAPNSSSSPGPPSSGPWASSSCGPRRPKSGAYGWWLCGVVFLLMAAAPLALVVVGDRAALRRAVLGDGFAEREPTDEVEVPRIARFGADGSVNRLGPLGPVNGNGNGNGAS